MTIKLILTLNLIKDTVKTTVSNVKTNPIVEPVGVSTSIQLLLYAVALLVGVGTIFYLMDLALKHSTLFMNLKKFMKKNYFVILILFPIFYLIYYYAYYLPNVNTSNKSLWANQEAASLLWTASLTFLGTGVVTGTLKWINNLAFFKKQFSDIIKSQDFSDVLSEKMKELALSDNYLLQRNDLQEIWQTVTLCKYKKEFPELYNKLQDKLENLLFKKNNISYYYKNFQINYCVELIDDTYISTTERTSFTIIRPNKDEFLFDFSTCYNNKDPNAGAKAEFFSKNANEIVFSPIDIEEVESGDYNTLTCSKKLSGHLEYHIESIIVHKQNIDNDRIFTYGSARIIDDLTINIEHSDNINITFVPLNGCKFYPNGANNPNRTSYINRDVLLSGEKFIMFFYRNN